MVSEAVNLFDLKEFAAASDSPVLARPLDISGDPIILDNLVDRNFLDSINQILDEIDWVPVGQNGIRKDYLKEKDQTIGSYRATSLSYWLADFLWERIRGLKDLNELMVDVEADNDSLWRAVGINPLLRFIRYREKGSLVPHYDSSYIESDTKKTLKTLVLYIRQSDQGGATRFIIDPNENLSPTENTYSDWERFAKTSEIKASADPVPGRGLIFNHRTLHDSEPVPPGSSTDKIILRTDIFYER